MASEARLGWESTRMSRARDADDAASARPWRWRRCGTFHAAEGGIWGTRGTAAARAAARWENAPLEGFGLRFSSGEEEATMTARALEARARATLGEEGLTDAILEETARATSTPSAASDDAATSSSVETRLASTRAMLRGLGVDEAKTKAVMARAMDAWGGDDSRTRTNRRRARDALARGRRRRGGVELRLASRGGAVEGFEGEWGLFEGRFAGVRGERGGVRRRGGRRDGFRGKVYAHRDEERPRWNVLLLRRRIDGDR